MSDNQANPQVTTQPSGDADKRTRDLDRKPYIAAAKAAKPTATVLPGITTVSSPCFVKAGGESLTERCTLTMHGPGLVGKPVPEEWYSDGADVPTWYHVTLTSPGGAIGRIKAALAAAGMDVEGAFAEAELRLEMAALEAEQARAAAAMADKRARLAALHAAKMQTPTPPADANKGGKPNK